MPFNEVLLFCFIWIFNINKFYQSFYNHYYLFVLSDWVMYFSRSRASSYQYSIWIIRNLWQSCIMVSFCNINVIIFVVFYYINIFNFFVFWCIICSFVPYGNLFTESTDCILLPSLPLKSVLLISSVNTLCFLFLSFWCNFPVNLLLLMNYYFLWDYLYQFYCF